MAPISAILGKSISCDFNCEAQYAARFRQQFLDDENVEVPEVIWGMSSEKVLCLSYLEGTKISDLEKLK